MVLMHTEGNPGLGVVVEPFLLFYVTPSVMTLWQNPLKLAVNETKYSHVCALAAFFLEKGMHTYCGAATEPV